MLRRRVPSPVGPGHTDRVPVVLATASGSLAEQVGRLAAAADVELTVVVTPAETRRWWPHAALLLLGLDMATALATAPTRREGVVLVGEGHAATDSAWRHAVGVGAEDVAVLPEAAARLVERLGDAVEGRPEARVVGLVGCVGGVGASTVLAALGLVAARLCLGVVLCDLDSHGSDVGLLLDAAEEPGLRWADLAAARGRLPSGSLAEALPQVEGLRLLVSGPHDPGPVPPEAIAAVLPALARSHDLVLLDLPRCWDPGVLTAVRLCTSLLLLTTADPRGSVGARRLLQRLGPDACDLQMVARTVRGGVDPDDLAAELGVPLLGTLRTDRRVPGDVERGRLAPGSPLHRTCRAVLAAFAPAGASR